MIYGYCRISTRKQNIERQIRNILKAYPTAKIIQETYTGTKTQERIELDKLIKKLKQNDTVVFDSVSRMSRNSDKGFDLYETLFKNNINLVFLREPHINTDCYKKALANSVELTGTNADIILSAINEYLLVLAKEQIKLAFDQSEKEVLDLRERTKQGIETARYNNKQIGQKKGAKLITKKSIEAKKLIKKYSKSFNGTLTDIDTMKIIGITRVTYYKYKKEIIDEI